MVRIANATTTGTYFSWAASAVECTPRDGPASSQLRGGLPVMDFAPQQMIAPKGRFGVIADIRPERENDAFDP